MIISVDTELEAKNFLLECFIFIVAMTVIKGAQDTELTLRNSTLVATHNCCKN